MYDDNNVFAKILRGEIGCNKVYENEYCLAFKDIKPAAPIHILFIPKRSYSCYQDFITQAEHSEIIGLMEAVTTVAKKLNLDKHGYRLVINNGESVGQTVFHFHIHLLAGEKLSEL